jgi:hypothetical protein
MGWVGIPRHEQSSCHPMAGCSGTRETCNGWNAAACRPPSCSPRARPVPRSPASWACRRRPPAAGMRAGVLAGMRTARHGKPPRLGPPSWPASAGCWTAGRWRPGSTTTGGPVRIAEVIERTTGVAHHPGHVWRILKAMRWSLQRPIRKALERDEAEIAWWVAQEWPRIKQPPKRAEPGSAWSTSRASS